MTTKLYIKDSENWVWTELPVYNRVEFDERLDEQLDSGSVQTITDGDEAFEDYSLYKLVTSDGETEKEEYLFGFDTVEKRGDKYFIHTIELVELTRILMGIPIDGMSVTQPLTGTKSTIKDVAKGLCRYGVTYISGERRKIRYEATSDVEESTISPEFTWECGTLLWECLCDVGNVINCIPRVVLGQNSTVPYVVKFDKVNEVTAEYEL